MAPLVLLQFLAGPLIDRLGARRVTLACASASVLVVGTIPLLHALGLLTFPVLLVLVALAGSPARPRRRGRARDAARWSSSTPTCPWSGSPA